MSSINNLIEQIKHTTYVRFPATPSDDPAALEKARLLEKAGGSWQRSCPAFKGGIAEAISFRKRDSGILVRKRSECTSGRVENTTNI